MLPAKPNLYRVAINRITFGARDSDVAKAAQMGWTAWVDEQLNPPPGDDPQLDAYLKSQTMHIEYPAATPQVAANGTWAAVKEDRPLNYIYAEIPALWAIYTNAGTTVAFAERSRVRQEIAAATWIRNAHSKYQVREFMVDFWHNHFNIGRAENEMSATLLPAYDRLVIRPNALGNFRTLLEATATSPSMLTYLDNWVSTSTTPNENYAREIMELHTLGGGAYFGTASPASVPTTNGVANGFTDQDIVQASRALSGWTIKAGQRVGKTSLPSTGEFAYSSGQHNTQAGTILGVYVGNLTADMAQGRKFLDIIAAHPSTATFIITKLAKRIFGDAPPQTVIDRGVATWMANQSAPDQIAKTMRSMIHDGYNELFYEEPTKVRRPYERIIAYARTTDLVLKASTLYANVLDSVNDGLFAWQAPNGRPDVNSYWLATGATVTTWNLLLQFSYFQDVQTSFSGTPDSATASSTAFVEYWVDRMVGKALSADATNVLVAEMAGNLAFLSLQQAQNTGTAGAVLDGASRRLTTLIATTEEFTLR